MEETTDAAMAEAGRMSKEGKRFQSAREVFSTYVPGYVAPPPPEPQAEPDNASLISQRMLDGFRQSLDRLSAPGEAP